MMPTLIRRDLDTRHDMICWGLEQGQFLKHFIRPLPGGNITKGIYSTEGIPSLLVVVVGGG